MLKISVIGLGGRIGTLLTTLLEIGDGDIKLTAIVDLKTKEQIMLEQKAISEHINKATFYKTVEEMLEKEELDGVMLGTRCSTHTKYALLVIEKGIPLFIEKPVAISIEEWQLLRNVYEKHNEKTVVSFPLRVSPLSNMVKDIVDSGKIGTIEHAQAFNYVPYGGVYYHNWYRDEAETGGLFMQKATHDFDYINHILGFEPVEVCAMSSKQIFKGNKPAGLKCVDCEEYYTCTDSNYVLEHFCADTANGDMCCFASDTGNHDSATAIVRYNTGMHMSYTQNFFARKHSAKRGAIFSGYSGTVEFDWYKDEIKVYMHHTPSVETYKLDNAMNAHFGGDEKLIRNFIDIMKGGNKSISPLRTGLVSALMCLKARESEKTGQFVKIDF